MRNAVDSTEFEQSARATGADVDPDAAGITAASICRVIFSCRYVTLCVVKLLTATISFDRGTDVRAAHPPGAHMPACVRTAHRALIVPEGIAWRDRFLMDARMPFVDKCIPGVLVEQTIGLGMQHARRGSQTI